MMPKEIDLDDILIAPAAVADWIEKATRIALTLKGLDPGDVPDEQMRVEDDGTLTIYVTLPGSVEVSMRVPTNQWAYRKLR